jgi:hypothetical protein
MVITKSSREEVATSSSRTTRRDRRAVRYTARKNKVSVVLPVIQELRDFMADLKVQRADGLMSGTMARNPRKRCTPT